MFSGKSVTYLKSLGISILHAYDKKFIGKSDRFHLRLSKKLHRILITLDRDFMYYKIVSLSHYPGVILISGSSSTTVYVNKLCQKALKKLTPHFIQDSLVIVTNGKIIREKDEEKKESNY